ncbi:hypothetical protein HPP92_021400 [Vanilla planifolia]|uniref:Uncharacterized protein n=1 Tax=Vanilla planifolia TaxID=51239 RepID=A0A835Q1W7_VANPL|nr:hypothetical protein HPP92_021400 [Vanilla planifolia]
MSTPASKEVILKEGEEPASAEPSDSENELNRKMSSASVCSTDGGEDDDDDGEEEDDEKNAHVVLGPQLALKEQLEMDKDDESLRKWKEQLLAGVDLSEVGENPDPK